MKGGRREEREWGTERGERRKKRGRGGGREAVVSSSEEGQMERESGLERRLEMLAWCLLVDQKGMGGACLIKGRGTQVIDRSCQR